MTSLASDVTDAELAAVANDADLTAAQRLAISRERMRRAMTVQRAPRLASRVPAGGVTSGATADGAAIKPSLGDRVRRMPGLMLLLEGLETWWMHHPMRTAALVAGGASRAAMRPVAQRSPFKLVLAAVLAGGVFAWSRPWRWLLRRALFAGLLPQLLSRVVRSLPIESWLGTLNAAPPATAKPSMRGNPPQRP